MYVANIEAKRKPQQGIETSIRSYLTEAYLHQRELLLTSDWFSWLAARSQKAQVVGSKTDGSGFAVVHLVLVTGAAKYLVGFSREYVLVAQGMWSVPDLALEAGPFCPP